ncbi:hypothetical protein ACE1MS_11710 [Lysinibacillus sp. fkY74-1]
MFTRENRVFFDTTSGRILWQTGEITYSNTPIQHEDIIGRIEYIDLPMGSIKYDDERLVSINPRTRKPIVEALKKELTPQELLEQKLKEIEELKKQLEGNGK